jgi:dTDP-glucose 4,6-dehydratase
LVSAAREKRPFPVHGSGQTARSITYVDDLIDGLLAVAAANDDVAWPINLGSDDEVTTLELATLLADVAGLALVTDSQSARPEEPEPFRPDTDRARALGWQARTNLRDGLRRTYSWAMTEAFDYV